MIKQASSQGSTGGHKGAPPVHEELMKEIDGLELFYVAPFIARGKEGSDYYNVNKAKEHLLCEI